MDWLNSWLTRRAVNRASERNAWPNGRHCQHVEEDAAGCSGRLVKLVQGAQLTVCVSHAMRHGHGYELPAHSEVVAADDRRRQYHHVYARVPFWRRIGLKTIRKWLLVRHCKRQHAKSIKALADAASQWTEANKSLNSLAPELRSSVGLAAIRRRDEDRMKEAMAAIEKLAAVTRTWESRLAKAERWELK